jgi:uncharacterized Ntn-hydrolase superfamily protein
MLSRAAALVCVFACAAPVPPPTPDAPTPRRPVATYSIVARDPDTGELGVAVQSHWFSVGPVVPWAEAGVGAVATQSFVNIAHGPNGLQLMRSGLSADRALDALLAGDPGRDVRQLGLVDAQGHAVGYTGAKCIVAAGHHAGEGYSVQANLMDKDSVWPAMARAYEASAGQPLAERLLAALKAAEAEGGDIRGRQSAALLVVAGKSTGRPWADRLVDLRVEDDPDPLAELSRLLRLHRAYDRMNAGDLALEHGDVEGAGREYRAALALAPEVYEIAFWAGVTLAGAGHVDEARPLLDQAFKAWPKLRELLPRLPAAGLLPDDHELLQRLGASGR